MSRHAESELDAEIAAAVAAAEHAYLKRRRLEDSAKRDRLDADSRGVSRMSTGGAPGAPIGFGLRQQWPRACRVRFTRSSVTPWQGARPKRIGTTCHARNSTRLAAAARRLNKRLPDSVSVQASCAQRARRQGRGSSVLRWTTAPHGAGRVGRVDQWTPRRPPSPRTFTAWAGVGSREVTSRTAREISALFF